MGAVLSVAVAIGIPLGIGTVLSYGIHHEVKGWYKELKKPDWTPPPWVFPPVWTALYAAMGFASWQVWKAGAPWLPLSLYGLQLVLNFAWTPLFFGKHEIGLALADISALLGVLTATIVEFYKVQPSAAYLMLPYLAWSAYATALTYDIYKKNPSERGSGDVKGVAKDAVKKADEALDDAARALADTAAKVQ